VELRRGERLLRSWRGGRARLDAYLEDYAAYADGLIALYQATFEPRWLNEARGLAEQILARFWDDEQAAFFDTAADHERLIARPRDAFDNATPSGNSLAAEVLQRLALFTGETRYAERARQAIAPLAEIAARYPNGFGRLLCALDFQLAEPKEVVIVGYPGDPATHDLLHITFGDYRPHMVVAGAAPEDPEAAAATPLLEARGLLDGRATAYVCEGFVCRAPTADPAEFRRQLDVA
jgi:uncharacterized protein YyaL (SSP411 family)